MNSNINSHRELFLKHTRILGFLNRTQEKTPKKILRVINKIIKDSDFIFGPPLIKKLLNLFYITENVSILRYLLSKAINPNTDCLSELLVLLDSSLKKIPEALREDLLSCFLKNAKPDSSCIDNIIPLCQSINDNHLIEQLINHGARPDEKCLYTSLRVRNKFAYKKCLDFHVLPDSFCFWKAASQDPHLLKYFCRIKMDDALYTNINFDFIDNHIPLATKVRSFFITKISEIQNRDSNTPSPNVIIEEASNYLTFYALIKLQHDGLLNRLSRLNSYSNSTCAQNGVNIVIKLIWASIFLSHQENIENSISTCEKLLNDEKIIQRIGDLSFCISIAGFIYSKNQYYSNIKKMLTTGELNLSTLLILYFLTNKQNRVRAVKLLVGIRDILEYNILPKEYWSRLFQKILSTT